MTFLLSNAKFKQVTASWWPVNVIKQDPSARLHTCDTNINNKIVTLMRLFKWKIPRSTFLWYCPLCCTRWFLLLSLWMKSLSVTIQMKATEQYFPVVLFIMLYKVVLTFESVDGILKCDHSNESYWAVLSCCTVYYAVQGGSNFWVWGWNL